MGAIAIAISSLTFLGLGCRGSKTDCDAAAANVEKLGRAALTEDAKLGNQDPAAEKERTRQEAMLPAFKEQLAESCRSEKWSGPLRECVAAAKTVSELNKCDPDRDKPSATLPDSAEPTEVTESPDTPEPAPKLGVPADGKSAPAPVRDSAKDGKPDQAAPAP